MVLIKNIHGEIIYTLPEDQELVYANLIGLDLREADLHGADLSMADLREANLSRADLTDADLSGACTIGTIFDDAILENTIMPIDYHHPCCC